MEVSENRIILLSLVSAGFMDYFKMSLQKILCQLETNNLLKLATYQRIKRGYYKYQREIKYIYYSRGATFTNKFQHDDDTFLYFAYGSNLLKRRIRINNTSAVFLGIGRLDEHQLDFVTYAKKWRGAAATIVPRPNKHVWGAIWRLHCDDMPGLDRQEGLDTNWYFAKTVKVVTLDGQKVQCRTYQQTTNPPIRKENDELPMDQRPCITYINCIINGAKKCNLPAYYIEELKKIPHNGQEATAEMIEHLKDD